MSEKNYMGDPASEFVENLGIGASLQPDAITSQVAQQAQKVGNRIVDIAQTLNSSVAMRHWIGAFRETTCDVLEQRVSTAQAAAARIDEHAQQAQAVAESGVTVRSVVEQNSQCVPGVSAMAQVTAVARALQNHYHEPGEPEYPALDYPGRTASAPSEDRGESPDGASTINAGGPTSGSAGGAPASPVDATPRTVDASAPEPDTSAEGAGAADAPGKGTDAGAQSAGGGSPSGGGSPAGGGAPSGATPTAGAGDTPTGGAASPVDGSGFDPGDAHTSAMSATDYAPSSSLGGAGLGAGASGEHERALSSKNAAASVRPGIGSVNVTTTGAAGSLGTGGMGASMAPGAMGGKPGEKEHKTPDYLKDQAHGRALLGGELPAVTPEVMGALTQNEIVKMDKEAREQAQQGGPVSESGDSASPVPPVLDGPQPRRRAGQQ